jgi:hypothetical protein
MAELLTYYVMTGSQDNAVVENSTFFQGAVNGYLHGHPPD